jgi:hypothetical protein
VISTLNKRTGVPRLMLYAGQSIVTTRP